MHQNTTHPILASLYDRKMKEVGWRGISIGGRCVLRKSLYIYIYIFVVVNFILPRLYNQSWKIFTNKCLLVLILRIRSIWIYNFSKGSVILSCSSTVSHWQRFINPIFFLYLICYQFLSACRKLCWGFWNFHLVKYFRGKALNSLQFDLNGD